MDFHDHRAITETVYRYAYGIDTRDWALYRSIFAAEIDIDFSSYNGRAPARMRADDWVAGVIPLFNGLDATQHSMSNPLVEIDEDVATCRMYVQAAHGLDHGDDQAWFTIGGHYTDRLARVGTGWHITAVTLTVLWRRGDFAIMTTAAKRGATRPLPT